jgi:amidophosphoribosyltransferase
MCKENCDKFDGLDKPHCNCAIFGIYGHPHASIMTYYGLHAQQHRGQEAAGISSVYYDEKKCKKRFAYHRNQGLVLDVFGDSKILTDVLIGEMAIGHNRYSTTGASTNLNIQPFNMVYHSGLLCLAHNGNLVNTKSLRKRLHNQGAIFQTTTDSEIVMHLIAHSREEKPLDQIREALRAIRGAYSLVLATEFGLVAACDPHGVRPLSLGRLWVPEKNKYSYVVASETSAFDIINAEYIRQIKHNEMIIIDDNTVETGEVQSFAIEDETPIAAHCIFEYIYFSRPDSKIFGHNVDKVRRKLGKNLAAESPEVDNTDKIRAMAVPDSGSTSALGYARANDEQGNPTVYEIGLIRSHYVGRTFIAPGQDNRIFKVRTKFNPVKGVIENRNIVLIDDSIVRGTTSKILLEMVKSANPRKINLKITSPKIKFPCFYGMDFPSSEELIANHYDTTEEISKALGADSLHYLSEEALMASVPHDEGVGYCTACFTGNYPISLEDVV